jgi:hypothetical protein
VSSARRGVDQRRVDGKLHSKAYQAVAMTYPELGVAPRLVVAADTEPSRARFAVDVLG